MRFTICTFIVGVLILGGPPLRSQTKQRDTVGKLMVEKLKYSKVLLEGIAMADFTKIRGSAEELTRLSKTEEWQVLKTPRYELFSNEFRRAAAALSRKAKAKNLDGVTLSYFEMVMSCVRCHQYVRETRDVRLPSSVDLTALSGHPRPKAWQ